MLKVFELLNSISSACFSPDGEKVALCPNNNELHIYELKNDKWVLQKILKDHDYLITGIDWDVTKGRLVTCSHDRNSYVYTLINGEWIPELVLLRNSRAGTCVKWSPNGKKFAVSSGDRMVSVCYYDDAGKWWVSKHAKNPFKSTVTSINWHPNNLDFIASSTGFKSVLVSAYIPEVDGKLEHQKFGEKILEFPSKSWVNYSCFSPDGNWIANLEHGSAVTFASQSKTQKVLLKGLPLRTGVFVNNSLFIGGGWDFTPIILQLQQDEWKCLGTCDSKELAASDSKSAGGLSSKMSAFDNKISKAASKVSETTHKNVLSSLSVFQDKFVTTAFDGKIVFWPFQVLKNAFNITV